MSLTKKISLLCVSLLCTNLINSNLGYSAGDNPAYLGLSIFDGEAQQGYKNPFESFNDFVINREKKYVRQVINSIDSSYFGSYLEKHDFLKLRDFCYRDFAKKQVPFTGREKHEDINIYSTFFEYEKEIINGILNDSKNICANQLFYIYKKPVEKGIYDYDSISLLMYLANSVVYKLDSSRLLDLIYLVDEYRTDDVMRSRINDDAISYLADIKKTLLLVCLKNIHNECKKSNCTLDNLYDLMDICSDIGNEFDTVYYNYISQIFYECLSIGFKNKENAVVQNSKQAVLRNCYIIGCNKNWNEFFNEWICNKNKFRKLCYFSCINNAKNNGSYGLNFYNDRKDIVKTLDIEEVCNLLLQNNTMNNNNKASYKLGHNIKEYVKKTKNRLKPSDVLSKYLFDSNVSATTNKILRNIGVLNGIDKLDICGKIRNVLPLNKAEFSRTKISDLSFCDMLSSISNSLKDINSKIDVISFSKEQFRNFIKSYNIFSKSEYNRTLPMRDVVTSFMSNFYKVFQNDLGNDNLQILELDKDKIIKFFNMFLSLDKKIGLDNNIDIIQLIIDNMTYGNLLKMFERVCTCVSKICYNDEYEFSSLNYNLIQIISSFTDEFVSSISGKKTISTYDKPEDNDCSDRIMESIADYAVVEIGDKLGTEVSDDQKESFVTALKGGLEYLLKDEYQTAYNRSTEHDRMTLDQYKKKFGYFVKLNFFNKDNVLDVYKRIIPCVFDRINMQADIDDIVNRAYFAFRSEIKSLALLDNLSDNLDIFEKLAQRVFDELLLANNIFSTSNLESTIPDSLKMNTIVNALIDNIDNVSECKQGFDRAIQEYSDKGRQMNVRTYYLEMLKQLEKYKAIDTSLLKKYSSTIIKTLSSLDTFEDTIEAMNNSSDKFDFILSGCIAVLDIIEKDINYYNVTVDDSDDDVPVCCEVSYSDIDRLTFYQIFLKKYSTKVSEQRNQNNNNNDYDFDSDKLLQDAVNEAILTIVS